jgi:glutaredoxin
MTQKVTVYTTNWCPFSKRAIKFLNDKSVEYTAVDIEEDEDAAIKVEGWNNGNRTVPTFDIEGKGVFTNPSAAQLTQLLELL